MRHWPAHFYRRRVIVNLRTDKAFRGVLWSTQGDWLELRQVETLDGTAPIAMLGDQLIERSNIDWIQVLPAGGE
jgi:hypothetical protein